MDADAATTLPSGASNSSWYGRAADSCLVAINLAAILFMVINAGLMAGLCWTLVVVLHEAGHAAVAKFLGAKIVKVLIIPYLGGVTFGLVRLGLDGEACFILGGVGLSSAAALILLAVSSGLSGDLGLWMGSFAALTAWINLLNLIPVSPLDGGRLLISVTKAWKAWVGMLLQGGMLAFLLIVASRTESWLLWVIVGITTPLFFLEAYLRLKFPARSREAEPVGRRSLVWLAIYLLHIALLVGIMTASLGRSGVAVRVSALFPF